MGKWIRRVVVLAVAGVFLYSMASIGMTLYRYYISDKSYDDTAEQFTALATGAEDAAGGTDGAEAGERGSAPGSVGTETAPIRVDFDGLRAVNGDIVGWIYCQDTPINYPVVRGEDNEFYLHHGFDGADSNSGAIFMEVQNRPGFADANTVIYGHHMKNGSMFAALAEYADQTFYEEHPVMWLLTPEQDYKIIVFSGYTASAGSDTYQIFEGASGEFDEYLETVRGRSDFTADMEPDGAAKYVLLSTCAYDFEDARYVIHGMLVPAGSAAGGPGEAGQGAASGG